MRKKILLAAGVVSAALALGLITDRGPSEVEKKIFDEVKNIEIKFENMLSEMNDIERIEKSLLNEMITLQEDGKIEELEAKRKERVEILGALGAIITEYDGAIENVEKINDSRFLNKETKLSGEEYLAKLNERKMVMEDMTKVYSVAIDIEVNADEKYTVETITRVNEEYGKLKEIETKYNNLNNQLKETRKDYVEDFGYLEEIDANASN